MRAFLDVINSAQCPAAIRHNVLAVNGMQHPALLCRFSVSTHMSNVLKLAVQFFNEKRGGINVGEQVLVQMWRFLGTKSLRRWGLCFSVSGS